MNIMNNDTIYALATAKGKSAIAVIRISGPRARDIPALFGADEVQVGRVKLLQLKAQDGQIIDEVIYFCFKSPASATGEDMAEIQCHGSNAVIKEILDFLSSCAGFRMAIPGEFTRRAIDNGKMDITSAEGLADLIDAETSRQRQQATDQMFGRLSTPIEEWRAEIIAQAALIESLIDFADEELPDTLEKEIQHKIASIITACDAILDDGNVGEIIRSGLDVAIIGPVNAGKSTALNALARRPAAIVSDHEGTTRDVIEVRLDIQGIPITIMDTAGFRETDDSVESQGIEMARERAEQADFRLIIMDATSKGWVTQAAEFAHIGASQAFIIANKSELLSTAQKQAIPPCINGTDVIALSLQNSHDIEALEKRLAQQVSGLMAYKQDPLITRQRHREAVLQASRCLKSAQRLSLFTQTELVAEEYRTAATSLSRILGKIDVEEVLDHIFSRFCIGK